MADKTLREAFGDIADAIRSMGVSGTMTPLQMPTKITSIPTGGGIKYGLSMDNILGDVNAQGALQPPTTGALSSTAIVSIPDNGLEYKFYKGKITSVSLPNMTTIGNWGMQYAFYQNTALTSVDLSGIRQITGIYALQYAFRGCTSLKNVYLNKLSTASSASGYLNDAFNGCTSLETVNFSEATAVPALSGTSAFQNTNNTFKIIVPNTLYNSWKSASNWSTYASQIVKANPGLQFNATTANSTVKLEAVGSPTPINLKFNVNFGTFSTYTIGDTITLTNVGDNVLFVADENGNATLSEDTSNYYQFVMTGSLSCEETVNYLLNADGSDSSSQSNAYCFYKLFSGCSSLTNVPQLPTSTNDVGCYAYMFEDCTGLTTAPELPYTLYANCYEGMFKGCTRLTVAPQLPATTLANDCYKNLFYGCSNLGEIFIRYRGNFSTTYFDNWVNGVAASGTFYYNGTDTTTGASAIPSGWTVEPIMYKGLAFTAKQANSTIRMAKNGSAPTVSLQYSTDEGDTWNTFTVGTTTVTLPNVGDRICFKATTTNSTMANSYSGSNNYFVMTGQFDASGNINSLLNEDMDAVTTVSQNGYVYLFKDCTSLIDASKLELKANATSQNSYGYMFSGCSNMTKGPDIYATTLGSWSLERMFLNCSVLNEIKLRYGAGTSNWDTGTFGSWVQGVQTTAGTFYYNGNYTTRGTSNIPANWTITRF